MQSTPFSWPVWVSLSLSRSCILISVHIFTDLKLDGTASAQARPNVGDWGPVGVPTTRRKRWERALVPVAFFFALTGLIALGFFFYKSLGG